MNYQLSARENHFNTPHLFSTFGGLACSRTFQPADAFAANLPRRYSITFQQFFDDQQALFRNRQIVVSATLIIGIPHQRNLFSWIRHQAFSDPAKLFLPTSSTVVERDRKNILCSSGKDSTSCSGAPDGMPSSAFGATLLPVATTRDSGEGGKSGDREALHPPSATTKASNPASRNEAPPPISNVPGRRICIDIPQSS